MAFKRSAVRSRLSPPNRENPNSKKSSEIERFQNFFFLFTCSKFCFSPFLFLGLATPKICATSSTRVQHELSGFYQRNYVSVQSATRTGKCLIIATNCILLRRFLRMRIIHCHIDFRMTNQCLDRFGIYA